MIRAQKTQVVTSAWTDEKLRAKDFPLLKKKGGSYPLSRRWRWQTTRFRINQKQFLLLASYHSLIPEFVSVLAEEIDKNCRVLARWEFHQSHPGWHVHTVCGDIDNVSTGIVKPIGVERVPHSASHHRHKNLLNEGYVMEDKVATAIALDLCGLPQNLDFFVKSAVPWF